MVRKRKKSRKRKKKARKRSKPRKRASKPRKKRSKKKKYKFPKNPKKGTRKTITTKNGRRVTFEATGVKGFGAWKIVSNK